MPTIWKIIKNSPGLDDIAWREWPDGTQESCLVSTPEFQVWLAEGNTPITAGDDITVTDIVVVAETPVEPQPEVVVEPEQITEVSNTEIGAA